jgi:hypothetical protein
LIEEALTQ